MANMSIKMIQMDLLEFHEDVEGAPEQRKRIAQKSQARLFALDRKSKSVLDDIWSLDSRPSRLKEEQLANCGN
jgi:hypothetical protein